MQILLLVLDANYPTKLQIFDNLMTGRNQDRDIKRIGSATCSSLIDCNFIFPSQTSTFASILLPITQSLEAKLLSLPVLRHSNSIYHRILDPNIYIYIYCIITIV